MSQASHDNNLEFSLFTRKSAPDLIADQLRLEIMSGTIAAGAQLKQSEIASRFGASIVPVREAFQRLVSDGLAIAQHNRGVTVTPTNEADFIDIAELRALLEPHALEKSAPHLGPQDFSQALEALRKSAKSTDLLERASLHWEFHRILYSKCDRPRLIAQIAHLHLSINRYILPMWSRFGLSDDWDQSHEDIVDAIRANRIDTAKQIVVDQIHESRQRVLSAIARTRTP
jgi:DNA-binding GntR family transcriptional regulator